MTARLSPPQFHALVAIAAGSFMRAAYQPQTVAVLETYGLVYRFKSHGRWRVTALGWRFLAAGADERRVRA